MSITNVSERTLTISVVVLIVVAMFGLSWAAMSQHDTDDVNQEPKEYKHEEAEDQGKPVVPAGDSDRAGRYTHVSDVDTRYCVVMVLNEGEVEMPTASNSFRLDYKACVPIASYLFELLAEGYEGIE